MDESKKEVILTLILRAILDDTPREGRFEELERIKLLCRAIRVLLTD